MNLNILKPGQAVREAVERPSLVVALVLVLLPSLVSALGTMDFNQAALVGAASRIVLAYVTFFLFSIVVFVLCRIVGSEKKRFLSVFSALSLMQIVSLAVVVLSLVFMPLVFSPDFLEFAGEQAGSGNAATIAVQVGQFIESSPDSVNFPLLYGFLLIGLALTLFSVYLLYLAIKEFTGAKRLTAVVITIVALIVLGALPI